MCGGGGYSSPPKPKVPSWNKFWEDLTLPHEDRGIFIEVVQGCDSVSCKLQCQARGMPKRIMPFDELGYILEFLASVKHPDIMLYGVGDVTNYHWTDFLSKARSIPGDCRVNISPTAKDEDILALAKRNILLNFNVNTPEEAILANMKPRNLGCRLSSIVVPVAKNVDWLEILKLSTVDIEFNSFTPSWSELYVTPEEFKDGLMSLGIGVEPTVYKLKSGFKPLIESCKKVKVPFCGELYEFVFTIRRCFQPDSKRMTIKSYTTPINMSASDDLDLFNQLNKLGNMKTNCNKCSEVVWYYNFRR